MAKIISANYRDRSRKYKWLVRDENQEPEQAIACLGVKAQGVTFTTSRKEQGFGCSYVAKAEAAELIGIEGQVSDSDTIQKNAVRLNFSTISGFSHDGKQVKKVSSLDLTDQGEMLATIDIDTTKEDAEKKYPVGAVVHISGEHCLLTKSGNIILWETSPDSGSLTRGQILTDKPSYGLEPAFATLDEFVAVHPRSASYFRKLFRLEDEHNS